MPANSQLVVTRPRVVELQLTGVQEENTGVYACLAHLGPSRDAITIELDIYSGYTVVDNRGRGGIGKRKLKLRRMLDTVT